VKDIFKKSNSTRQRRWYDYAQLPVKPDETLLRPSITHLLGDGAPGQLRGQTFFVGLEINRAGMIAAADPNLLIVNMEAL